MTTAELYTLFGIGATAVTLIGGFIARDRYIQRQITDGDERSRAKASDEAQKLHDRINRVRDEYVRRVDLDAHIIRLDQNVQEIAREMRDGQKGTNQRLDAILAHFTIAKGDR